MSFFFWFGKIVIESAAYSRAAIEPFGNGTRRERRTYFEEEGVLIGGKQL